MSELLLEANSKNDITNAIGDLPLRVQFKALEKAIQEVIVSSEIAIQEGDNRLAIVELTRLAMLEDYQITVEHVYARQGLLV